MPAVHIRANDTDPEAAAGPLAVVARRIAEAVPCDIEGVWCTFTPIGVQTVGERARPGEGRIVYVDVWIRPREGAAAVTRALEAACHAAAAGFGVPVEDVWGTLRPVESMRVFAGGALIED